MTVAEKIQKLGFLRWYERALLEGHAFFVTAFLGVILVVASLEVAGERTEAADKLFALVCGAGGTALVLYSLRRYLRVLVFAGNLSAHATCGRCNTYASFNVLSSNLPDPADVEEPGSVWLKVKCRCCGNEWVL